MKRILMAVLAGLLAVGMIAFGLFLIYVLFSMFKTPVTFMIFFFVFVFAVVAFAVYLGD